MNVTMGTGQAPFNWVRWLDYCPGGLQLGEAKAPEAAKAAMASFLTQLCHSLKRPQTMWSFLHIRSI